MSRPSNEAQIGLFAALVGDGRPLIAFTAVALIFSGAFAFFQSASGEFLPHDIAFLGLSADELGAVANGRVRSFMFHDRVAFGGALLAIGVLYLWLVKFPLRDGAAWAWWTLAASGLSGFGSFLAYLGYGYLDTWHAAATIALLPIFGVGLVKSLRLIPLGQPFARIFAASNHRGSRSRLEGLGRAMLLATGAGMVLAGMTILVVGMTTVFVPQDLAYMGVDRGELARFSERLIPLIAHDRAGFGGGIGTCGLVVFACVWCGRPSRALRQALAIAGVFGFGSAIGVHYFIGYTDVSHLAPAFGGLALFLFGWACLTLGAGRAAAALATENRHSAAASRSR